MSKSHQSVYIFILINYAIYAIDTYVYSLSFLYLNHGNTSWYTVVTSAFCHANFTHLSGNMFFIYFFGRLIEDNLNEQKFLFLYLGSAILVNLLSLLVMPSSTVSLGASGVVFAFFSISIMMKLVWDWKAWVEIAVLLPFVLSHLFNELNSLGANDSVGHFAHLSGMAFGVLLYLGLKRIRL